MAISKQCAEVFKIYFLNKKKPCKCSLQEHCMACDTTKKLFCYTSCLNEAITLGILIFTTQPDAIMNIK